MRIPLQHRTACSVFFTAALGACGPGSASTGSSATDTSPETESSGTDGSQTNTSSAEEETGPSLDTETGSPTGPSDCFGDNSCNRLDLLIVVDNSASMIEEQRNLARNFATLAERITTLTDERGELGFPSVNIMVTTTDVGHGLCASAPKPGAPVSSPCSERLDDFVLGDGEEQLDLRAACSEACPDPVAPIGDFIRYDEDSSNVPQDDIVGALSCLGPQGVRGCAYSSPLEAMLAALDPEAPWNTGPDPFLRDDSPYLAIMLITDTPDCSVAPAGMPYFTDPAMDDYWAVDPDTGTKTQATRAVCWSGGVACDPAQMDGSFPGCDAVDLGVLHPTERYVDRLRELIDLDHKQVLMLPVVGVPLVTEHNANFPFNPIAGGVLELSYRPWAEGVYPAGDLLPGDPDSAAIKQFEHGIGPGCTELDDMGEPLGQAMAPVRVLEVCESLNDEDALRCYVESMCDEDLSRALYALGPWDWGGPAPIPTD